MKPQKQLKELQLNTYQKLYFNTAINPMTFSNRQKIFFTITLTIAILLTGLHFATIATGFTYIKNQQPSISIPLLKVPYNIEKRTYNQYGAFIIVTAIIIFFLSIVLLIDIFCNRFSLFTKTFIAAVILILQFSIAVTLALIASRISIIKDQYSENNLKFSSDSQTFYEVSIADAIITFGLLIPCLFILFIQFLSNIASIANKQVKQPNLPPTADRF